jgi:membrane-bound lytic murein transglycosylase B
VSTDGLTLTSAEVEAPAPARAAPGWVDAVARATGIPAVALQGYADATLTLDREDPGCRLGWTTLAGIGAIESGHGTYGGSALGEDGRAFPAIIGPALDGVGFAAIRASDFSVTLDGDPRWQHAVGPLQFLPDTWERWGTDGDGDGRQDPQDIDDAALAAGRYLCAGSGDLATAAGWHRAVLSYNHDEEYVATVLVRADAYATASRAVATAP